MELRTFGASTSDNGINSESVKYHSNIKKPVTTLANITLTRLSRRSIHIEFEDIIYSVSLGFRKGKKEILHGISGSFAAGQLIGIVGPSGAGKTKLLDVLSGYRIGGVSGTVYTNGIPRNLEVFKKSSCYIPQDDRLQLLLTTEENMHLVADLKRPSLSKSAKKTIINEILQMLGLEQAKNTRAADLLGGQKKLLSIALELVTNPMVMFLDEPTTGLDISSCSRCIIPLLKYLAQQGRTIVCALHQPSASIFELLDQVYVLGDGKCVYQGTPHNLVNFLACLDSPCPYYHNPADYVIDLACGEGESDKMDAMVAATGNGKVLGYNPEKYRPSYERTINNEDGLQGISSLKQLGILLRRCYIQAKRDKTLTYLRFMVSVLMALMMGTLFWQSGNDGTKILDTYKFLFATLTYHMWSTVIVTTLTFPSELSILIKEHFNGWYSLKMYYTSITLIDIPINISCCAVFSIIVYLMTGQPLAPNRFYMFFVISLLVSLVAQSFGLMIGAIFNVTTGSFLGTVLSIPIIAFSGAVIALQDLPTYFSWAPNISYMKYGFDGIITAIYGYNRAPIPCPVFYCFLKNPKRLLEILDVKGDQFSTDVTALLINLLVFKIVAYVLLRLKLTSVR